MLNAERIALLPDGAIVVNTSRGAVVDDEALIAALKSGRHYVGFEIDPAYLQLAGERIAAQDFNHRDTGDTENTE